MPKAKPSSRSAGDINISFGLITIATTLYSGTVSEHGVKRSEFVQKPEGEEDSRAGRGVIDKATGALLEAGDVIVKKVSTDYGPVYVEDHEIEHLFQLSPNTFIVKSFEPIALFRRGEYVPKTIQFVEPRKVGSGKKKDYDPTAKMLLATLLAAMKDEGAIAIGEVTTRGVPKPAALLPDGTLWHLWHTDALREQRPLPEVPVSDANVKQMGQLMKQLWSDEVTDLTDERSILIQNFADEKAAAGEFGKPDEVKEQVIAAEPAEVDISALLSASIEAAKAS